MTEKPMTRDLYLAVLSMDVYHRTYGQVVNLPSSANGKIANATILNIPSTYSVAEWEQRGYFSIAYDTTNVGAISEQTTLAFRGTNPDGSPFDEASPFYRDIVNGWTVAVGLPGGDGGQADMALKFYQDVKAVRASDPGNMASTGHSLGGGLGGFIGSLHGHDTTIFDHMPWEFAAEDTFDAATVDLDFLEEYFGGDYPGNYTETVVKGRNTTGEFLGSVRGALGSPSNNIDSHGGLRNPLDLHSMALLTNLIWADDNGKVDWHSVARPLWNSFFNSAIAEEINGIQQFVGQGQSKLTAMQYAIAYSVIDEGEKPFGDTGVRAMFNDADELGRVKSNNPSEFFENWVTFAPSVGLSGVRLFLNVEESLAAFVVQYAGMLATADITGSAEAKEGVLSLSDDETILAFDASDEVWKDPFNGTGISGDPINLENFREEFLEQTDENWFGTLLRWAGISTPEDLARTGWEASSTKIFDRFHVRTRDDITAFTLPERVYGPAEGRGDEASVDVFVGTDLGEEVTGTQGNDLLFLSDGADTVYAEDGDDLVNAGEGDDIVWGGEGQNLLIAGDGDDEVLYNRGGLGVELTVTLSPDISAEGFGILDQLDVQARVEGTNSEGDEVKDLLFNFETMTLTDMADEVTVGKESFIDFFREEITIDFGEGGADGDTLIFDKRETLFGDQGVYYHNGAVQVAVPGLSAGYFLTNFAGVAQPALVRTALFLEDLVVPDDQVYFENVDNITLTDNDDRFLLTDRTDGGHSGNGEIKGEGGRDVLYVSEIEGGGEFSLDGGEGDDIVIALGDQKVITAGGPGRDVIINTTPQGELYGDSFRGGGTPDGPDNGDMFWFAPDTTIYDPEKDDILTFYGVPLTGGDAANTSNSFALGAQFGSLDVIGQVSGAFSFYSVVQSAAVGGLLRTFFDTWLPNVAYILGSDNSVRLANMTDILFRLAAGEAIAETVDLGDGEVGFRGFQEVRDFEPATADQFNGLQWWDDFGGFLSVDRSISDDVGDFGWLFNFPSVFSVIMGGLGAAAQLIKVSPVVNFLFTAYDAISLADAAMWLAGAAIRRGKAALWAAGVDPLVIDLDGDGIETVTVDGPQVYFDMDNDLFAEVTGWIDGDDGFLVRDENNNDRIDNLSEMFGNQFEGGFEELAQWDAADKGGNEDGQITAADAVWNSLQIWRDLNEDGYTDQGELFSLEELGIVSFDLNATPLEDVRTPQGAELLAVGDVHFADGSTVEMLEAIFETFETYTRYAGEAGLAAWQQDLAVDSKGYGSMTDLSVAMANDIELGLIVDQVGASMTEPDFYALRDQVGPILSYWGQTMELTRELTPVLLREDAEGNVSLADRGIYQEDDTGGFWTLASGDPVLDGAGTAIDRPTLEDVLAQAELAGDTWQLEQTWSPGTRGNEVQFRDEAPYLAEIVDGRAKILDFGVQNPDGSWRLASGRDIVDATGNLIPAPTVEDILALSREVGTEWRVEEIGFNPFANIEVEHIGVRVTDGVVVDYTVEVTDQDGTFYVWARNLDRALELQFKTGDSREFALRNYAVDFDTLDEVGSSDDSAYRVELLTPGQFHFSMSLGGLEFQEEMLTATLDNDTGLIDYKIVEGGDYTTSTETYESVIDPMIDLVEIGLQQYFLISRRLAVRVALQDGLKDFADGIEYDVVEDVYRATSDEELVPMFKKIFEGAPGSNIDDAIYDYFVNWNAILTQVYPDYKPADKKYFFDPGVGIDQTAIFQNIIAAVEAHPVDLDIFAIANAFAIDERRVITHEAGDTEVRGADGVNFFYLSEGDQSIVGSFEADAEVFDKSEQTDIYFVGGNSGDDYILDRDLGNQDQLRFATIRSDEVRAVRDGEDLILFYNDGANFVRVTDQFLGELNIILTSGDRVQTGVDEVVFADGVVWDRYRMSFAVVDFDRADQDEADAYFGSGSGDILLGGKGNDYMSGGAGGDTYVIRAGDGHDVIDDLGNFSFGPVQAGMDFLMFRDDITQDTIRLTRDGASENLVITILDEDGNETGQSVELVGQFGGVRLNLGAFSEVIGADDGLDFVAPNLIEKIIFEQGTTLEYADIVDRVLENAKTDGDDAIYGMLNDNTMDGGAGDDFLTGVEGFDTYIYGRDYGKDVILDADFASSLFGPKDDLIRFTDDLRWTDFDFLRDGPGDTLTLRVKGTEDEVIFTDYLDYIILVGYTNLIEDLEFADGTVWNYLKLLQHYVDIAKTDGDDLIYGFEGINDRIDGGLGNDRLEGQSGSDTYVFAAGYGVDTILDSGGSERVEFQGFNAGDVEFSRTALDLIITIRGTGDQVVLENQYVREGRQQFAVEFFQFADSTLEFTDFNPEDIDLVGTNAGETITGSNFSETIDGRGGDDLLIGGDGGDIYLFDVGYGEDIITDTRIRAAWSDREGIFVPVDDIVRFGDDITQDNVVFTKDGNDLVISVLERTDTLRIRNQFLDLDNGVERFEFSDGGFLLISDVEELLQIEGGNRGDNIIEGNPTGPNTLDGRQGDDTLIGGSAEDIYAFGADYDFDRIVERPDVAGVIDTVQFGASVTRDTLKISRDGDDLIIDLGSGADVLTIVGGLANTRVEQFRFGDASILTLDEIIDRMLTGTDADEALIGLDNRDDTITSGAGSDAMEGGAGDDTYRYGYGDGSDSIFDTSGFDSLLFGTGITQDGVTFENIDGDLLIKLAATDERIAVLGGYRETPVERFVFEDGSELSIGEVRALIREGQDTAAQDLIDTSDFDAGVPIEPGAGHDTITLSDGAQVVMRNGGGIDRVEMPRGVSDAALLFPDITSADVVVRFADGDSNDLILSVPGTGDQVLIVGALGSGAVPELRFANGVTWGADELVQAAVDAQASTGDDVVLGSDRADTLEGNLGDDQLRGGRGDDTYIYRRGDGQDVIEDERGFDRLELSGYRPEDVRVERLSSDRDDLILTFAEAPGDAIIIREAALEIVGFTDGTEWTRDTLLDLANAIGSDTDDLLRGTTGEEIYRPGFGNDLIIDGQGNDIYTFSRGDGQDRITSDGAADGFGTILFGAGITLEEVTSKRDADGNIILMVAGTDDRLTLVDPTGDPDAIVGTLEFADGRSVSIAGIARSLPATDGDDHIIIASGALANGAEPGTDVFGRDGNDWLETGRGADVIYGDLGNDLLQGHSGGDTYFFARGDGQDVIADVELLSGDAIDRIRFEAGIAPEDIRILSVGPTDLVIGIAGGSDRLTIQNMFGNVGVDGRIEEFVFATGETLDLAAILALATTGGAEDDDIDLGTEVALDAVLAGGAGYDRLAGGQGDTTYLFNPGDGRDEVVEAGNWSGSNDEVRFGAGFDPADMVAVRQGNDLLLRFVGHDDSLLIKSQFSLSRVPVEAFRFEGGSVLSAAEVAGQLLDEAGAQALLSAGTPDQNPFGDALFARDTGDSDPGAGAGSGIGVAAQGRTLTANDGVVDIFEFFVPELDEGAPLTTIVGFETGDLGDILDIRIAAGLAGEVVARTEGTSTFVYFVDEGVTDLAAARRLIKLEDVAGADLTLGNFNGAPFASADPQAIDGTADPETLTGGWGDDTIRGLDGNDILDGAEGNDLLQGGSQNDTYRFDVGFGQDIVSDAGWSNRAGTDVIEFGPGIDPADLRVTGTATDLILSFVGSDDQVTIQNTINNSEFRIESVRFDDGTELTHAELAALAWIPTDGDQRAEGTYDADTIGLGGGNDSIFGKDGNDLITGGTGNDFLQGGSQNDTYLFEVGFGQDILSEGGWSNRAGDDTIVFGAGIDPADMRVKATATDIILTFVGTEDRITIQNTVNNSEFRVETVRFDDGTVFTHADLLAQAWEGSDADQRVDGTYGGDLIDTGGGNDSLFGRDGNDILIGGTGNDFLQGGSQDDTYRFEIGFGQDILSEGGWSSRAGNDTIELGAGLRFEDLRVEATATDLILTFVGLEDRITIQNTINNSEFRVESVVFDDGTVLTHADLTEIAWEATDGDDRIDGTFSNDVISTGGGNDTVFGNDGADTITGGAGNDFLRGGSGNDTFKFDVGFGQDIVSDAGWSNNSPADVIEFGAGLQEANLRVRADGNDIVLSFVGSEDRLRIENALSDNQYAIETIQFTEDGTSLTHAELVARATAGTTGDDTIIGTSGVDVLDGLAGDDEISGNAGNDTLLGGDGFDTLRGGGNNDRLNGGPGDDLLIGDSNNDTYVFGRGFGRDLVDEGSGSSWSSGTDLVEFDASVLSTEVTVYQDGNDLVLAINGTEDEIRLVGTISGGNKRVESVYFTADDVTFDHATLLGMAQPYGARSGIEVQGDPDNNLLIGTDGDDLINGVASGSQMDGLGGNDSLIGGNSDEILTGGTGNDLLSGRNGNDVYRFSIGFGQDRLDDLGLNPGDGSANVDRIEFDATILPTDLIVERTADVGGDLILKVIGTEDRLTIVQGANPTTVNGGIDEVRFDDGTVWSLADLLARAVPANPDGLIITAAGGVVDDDLSGTTGSDDIYGLDGSDTLNGLEGNDYLEGGNGDDILVGGPGNDYMYGGPGSDTYRFSAGFGQDYVDDGEGGGFEGEGGGEGDSAPNIIEFDGTLSEADLEVFIDEDRGELLLRFAGTSDVVSMQLPFIELIDEGGDLPPLEEGDGELPPLFLDGAVEGVAFTATESFLSLEDLMFMAVPLERSQISGDVADDTLTGTALGDEINGFGGDDTLSGLAGNDTLLGGAGDDSLDPGLGRDVLDGEAGSDTYLVSGPFDHVTIAPSSDDTGADLDVLDLTWLAFADTIVENNANFLMQIALPGSESRIVLEFNAVDEVRFADVSYSFAEMQGFAGAAAERGVRLSASSTVFELNGTDFDDQLSGRFGTQILNGGAGADSLFGSSGDDFLTGGAGHDLLDGGRNNDIYYFSTGFGHDIVQLETFSTSFDVIEFDATILPGDITVYDTNGTITLVADGGDSSILLNDRSNGNGNQIAEIRFEDGTVWSGSSLPGMAVPGPLPLNGAATDDTLIGDAGNNEIDGAQGADILSGLEGDDEIQGGAGFDIIDGGVGDDTLSDSGGGALYLFSAGFGQDRIINLLEPGTPSAILFDATITPLDVRVEGNGEGGEVTLRIIGTGDQIEISEFGPGSGPYGIDEVRFDDGTIWSAQDLQDMAVPGDGLYIEGDNPPLGDGGAGDDQITGGDAADVLIGNGGNDDLNGEGGRDILDGGPGDDILRGGFDDDIYRFSTGFGQDLITDSGWSSDDDAIEFDATIAPADVVIEQAEGSNDLVLRVLGTEDRITVQNGASSSYLDEVRFDDGTVWTREEILSRVVPAAGIEVTTSITDDVIDGTEDDDLLNGLGGDDEINGLGGTDELIGGPGNDILRGGPGRDVLSDVSGDEVYHFDAGDGFDQITDLEGTDRLEFGAGILPADVEVTVRNGTDLLLRFAGSEDRIELIGAFASADNRIEEIAFADGTVWTHADLVAFALAGTEERDVIVGTAADETIDGLAGDDDIDGSGGDDILFGGTGSDDLSGGAGNDDLTGGTGADILRGGLDDDTYRFGVGSGQDTIVDTFGVDHVAFAAGLLPEALSVSISGDDIVLRVIGTEDRLTLQNQFSGNDNDQIEELRFADGTVWTAAMLAEMALGDLTPNTGTDGNDDLRFGTEDNAIDTGRGVDLILDEGGNDVYTFELGDGQKQITDQGGFDAIEFGLGINPVDVWLQGDTVLRIDGTEDRITIIGGILDPDGGIEEVRFADGTIWGPTEFQAMLQASSDGDDTIVGTEAADVLSGGLGDDEISGLGDNDTLSGDEGNDVLDGDAGDDILSGGTGVDLLRGGADDDTYRYNLGDGQDQIDDSAGLDRIEFGAGITADGITVQKSGTSLEMLFEGTEDRLTIFAALDQDKSIETIVFADGTEWDAAELLRRATAGTDGNDDYTGTEDADVLIGLAGDDTLTGLGGADLLEGGADNDTLDGGEGTDTLRGGPGVDSVSGGAGGDLYQFMAGDGVDVIDDMGDATIDTLRIEGYTLDLLRFSQTGPDGLDLTIRFAGSTDRIEIRGAFAGDDASLIEVFEIVDSLVTLNFDDVAALVAPDIGIDGLTLYGDETPNTLTGSALGDYIEGGDGADTMDGGAGNDIFGDIVADEFTDTMTGGAGRDTYRYLPSFAIDSAIAEDVITDFTPGDAGDIIRLVSSTPNPFANGRLELVQDGPDTLVRLYGDDGVGRSVLRLEGVDATLLTPSNFGGVALERDTSGIRGDETDNVIAGGPLDDLIFGNGGADEIDGFGGNDSLTGGGQNDVIRGGFGNDLISGDEGDDDLSGGAGNDILSGGLGDDLLTGGDSAAQFSGNDIFLGGAGDDTLRGGTEDDTYIFGANDGRDTLSDEGGADTIEFDATVAPQDLRVVQIGDDLELRIVGGDTRILILDAAVSEEAGIETVLFDDGSTLDRAALLTLAMTGTDGDDVLNVLSGNALGGLGGNDELTGSDADDTLTGGTGDDLLRGGKGNDTYVFDLGDGQDLIDDTQGKTSCCWEPVSRRKI